MALPAGIPARMVDDIADAIDVMGEDVTYTPRATGQAFTVRGAPHGPSPNDLTAGMAISATIVAFAPKPFLEASGGEYPKRGDLLEFGGKRYNVEDAVVFRRAGTDYRFNAICGG